MVRTSTRLLSSSSKTSSIHIQWIPAHIGIPGNTLADLEAKRGSTLPASIWSHLSSISITSSITFSRFQLTSTFLATLWQTWRPRISDFKKIGGTWRTDWDGRGATLNAASYRRVGRCGVSWPFLRLRFLSIWQQQRFWSGGWSRRSLKPATYVTRTQPHIAPSLEIPTRRHTGDLAGPEASASLLPSWEQVTVRFWPATSTTSDDNSLQCVLTAEATTRRHSIFFFAVRHTHRHVPLPTTSTQLIIDACSPFWSRSGLWHAPLRPGMRGQDMSDESDTTTRWATATSTLQYQPRLLWSLSDGSRRRSHCTGPEGHAARRCTGVQLSLNDCSYYTIIQK